MIGIHILVVEDEERLRQLIVRYLKNEGYTVYEAADGKEAIDKWQNHQVDLIILDVVLPEMYGWDVLKIVRENSKVPVIMLTARSEEQDKIHSFNLGVDQYVTKPFSTKELMARVKSILRRENKITQKEEMHFGDLYINTEYRQIKCKDEFVDLSPREYDLLMYLIINKNNALSREMILDRVWGYDYIGDFRTVDTYVKRLRQRLGEVGDWIVTIRGIGYRFEVKE